MRSKASARFSRIAPRKARMIADLVRGRDAAEAIQLLQFTQKSGAPVIKKILESAVANAQQDGADVDVLVRQQGDRRQGARTSSTEGGGRAPWVARRESPRASRTS